MDITIGLNTGNEGEKIVSKTKKINGKIDAIILKFEGFPIDLKIVSELGYTLLDIKKFQHKEGNTTYFPLQVQGIDNEGHGANYSNAKYYLNETLGIRIAGPKNQEVEIIIRHG